MSEELNKIKGNWEIFRNLPKHVQIDLTNHIDIFRAKPGEIIIEKDQLPPGLIKIKDGKVRLLSLDQNKEPFTLSFYKKGDIIGGTQILKGSKNSIFAASSHVTFELLPISKFLEIVNQFRQLLDEFNKVEAWEIYELAKLQNNPQFEPSKKYFEIAKNICFNNKLCSINLEKGVFNVEDKNKFFIVASSNLKDIEEGTLLESPFNVEISGRLPARLIPINDPLILKQNYLPQVKKKSKNLKKEPRNLGEEFSLQKNALEDWYGRMRDDGTYPIQYGTGLVDESIACLRMISRHFDLPFRKDVLSRIIQNQIENSENKQITLPSIGAILDILGLRSTILSPDSYELFSRSPTPSLIIVNGHPQVLWELSNTEVIVGDPLNGLKNIKLVDFFNQLSERKIDLLYIERSSSTPKARFGLRWFIPSLKKHKGALLQVVITSFFVQLLGLFNPLLIQQIIDAVISQGNYSSLNVLGTLLIAMAISQALLGSLRTYLFADTTNRIDISLGAVIINHLLRLPLSYFSRRPVGEVSSRIGELEKIRGFLTGTALTVVLDSIFSVIYIAVMLMYSVPLTLAALGVVPLFIILTVIISPIIRRQLREGAEANAKVQSHLVETLTGMETVKGQGMELPSEWRWEQLYGGRINAGFRNTITSTAAGSANQFLGQLSGLIIIWYGAILVLQGKLSLGQLIAFRILSGYVTSPLLRLASLWQNFQETALSLERLSDIVDHPEEIEITGQNLPPLPPIVGAISYENVNFRFGKTGPMQILNVNFNIEPGDFVGIVGSSGSGKSTLLKLLTRLFNPNEGIIKVDSYDISKIDLYSLRSQIGVVPQDSLLFEGSIKENISLTKPDASFEEIVNAAKIACAHEFIQNLPNGYSSSVGERGSSLSGGQRQRIAIARMILKNPRLLILDEATSALDVDTEKRLTRNLANSYKSKTVLFITHRLGSLKNATKILVLDEGSLVEQGNHKDLIKLKGRYSILYKQQEMT